jgi:hypothetical protein
LTAADIANGRYFRLAEIKRLQQAGNLDNELHWAGSRTETEVNA